MKNKILISLLVLIIILSIIIYYKCNSTIKINLNSKYYNNGSLKKLNVENFNKLVDDKESFVIYINIPGVCHQVVPFDGTIKKFIKKYNIAFYTINFYDIKDTDINKYVKNSPSVAIYKKGEIFTYLKPDSDDHLKYYQSINGFEKWFRSYVNVS